MLSPTYTLPKKQNTNQTRRKKIKIKNKKKMEKQMGQTKI